MEQEQVQLTAKVQAWIRVPVRRMVLAQLEQLSGTSVIVRFALGTRQCRPSSSTIPATNCSEAAGAFYDSTFATLVRFHAKTISPVRLDVVARVACTARHVIRREEALGPQKRQ